MVSGILKYTGDIRLGKTGPGLQIMRIARFGVGFSGLPIAALNEIDALQTSVSTGESGDTWRKYAYR
jgi:hypothetical protein